MTTKVNTERYWETGAKLICRDCSTRITLVSIPIAEVADHDAWHAEQDPAAKFRGYVVGLPVAISINDEGFVRVEVDLSELSWSIVRDSDTSTLQQTSDAQLRSDAEVLSRWVATHMVMNEDHAPTADEVQA